VSKQDRRDKAAKKGKTKAEAIIEETKAKVGVRKALPQEHLDLAEDIKELRAKGESWMAIGAKYGFPGSKTGAAYARKVYKAAFGEVPRVQAPRGQGKRSRRREKNEHVAQLRETKREERVVAARNGQGVIKPEMTDDEVIEMLQGRTITYSINLDDMDGKGDLYEDRTVAIFPKGVKLKGTANERMVYFYDYDPKGPLLLRGYPGNSRVVRLNQIHTVR
jgi:hypothetical protein